jgi:hypothetical protein
MAALLGLPSDRLKFTPHCRSSDHAFKSSETAASPPPGLQDNEMAVRWSIVLHGFTPIFV